MNSILLLNVAVIQVNLMVAMGAVSLVAALNVYENYNARLVKVLVVVNK